MHPVLASALIALCWSVETRTVSASDWWDASYAWPWLCFRHTVIHSQHSIPALDLVWLIRPPAFLGHLLFSFVTHSAISHPPNAIKEIKRRRTKMRASSCPGFMGVMSQALSLSAARVGSSGSARCALEMRTGVFTHFQHPRQNSPLFLGFETMKIITVWRRYTSHKSVRDSDINGSISNNYIYMGVWESWRPVSNIPNTLYEHSYSLRTFS